MDDTGERLIPEGHHKTLTYGEHLSRYLSVLDITKGKTVLDIASGAGYGTKLIAGSAKKVYGIDYSADAVAYAQNKYGASNITYKVGDAHDLPLPDDSVDVVVSLETIEHLKDPKKFIKEVKRVLKKDGQFIVSTPNDDEFVEGNEFHIHEFDLKELQKLIKQNFSDAAFYYQGTYFSAGLFSKDIFEKGGRWQGHVEKTFGQPVPKAIYFLAVASDARVGGLAETVVLADTWSTKDDLSLDHVRQQEKQNLQTVLEELQQKEQSLEAQKRAAEAEVTAIKNSRAWKLVQKVYRIRDRIVRPFIKPAPRD